MDYLLFFHIFTIEKYVGKNYQKTELFRAIWQIVNIHSINQMDKEIIKKKLCKIHMC